MVSFPERAAAVAGPLRRDRLDTLQLNLGRRCNQACLHCHVEAGPDRPEAMSPATAERILRWLATTDLAEVDLTGGAPELAPCFRHLLSGVHALGRRLIVRHNLTVQQAPGQADLPELFAAHGVRVVASLPCYLEENVDRQRGRGAFAGSLLGLRRLNAVGYGQPGSGLRLDLVHNPLGPALPPPQDDLREAYAEALREQHGVVFNDLLTLANVPIGRFRGELARDERLADYERLLAERFNPETLPALMCRSLVSVDWQGRVYDCDFNQMLDLRAQGRPLWELAPAALLTEIRTAGHCYACTAGAGSSCGGSLTEARRATG